MATFLTFAGISGYLGAVGVASCGCFGSIEASPWLAFGMDLVALTLLGLFRPKLSSLRQMTRTECRRLALSASVWVLGIGAVLAAVTITARLAYGSTEVAIARIRGEVITVSASYADFGIGDPGQVMETTVHVKNWTNESVRLIGGTANCSCVTTDSLPSIIVPGCSLPIIIKLKVPRTATGDFTQIVVLWTDCDRQRTVKLIAACRIRK